MLTAASGLSSGNQVSTYQQNRTNAKKTIHPELANVYCQSKPEIVRGYKFALDELSKLREELEHYKAQSRYYLNQSNHYQEQILELQDTVLKHLGIEERPYMKVAE
jgi:hypothetical protein